MEHSKGASEGVTYTGAKTRFAADQLSGQRRDRMPDGVDHYVRL